MSVSNIYILDFRYHIDALQIGGAEVGCLYATIFAILPTLMSIRELGFSGTLQRKPE